MSDNQVENTTAVSTETQFQTSQKPKEAHTQRNRKHKFKKPCWICRQGKLLIDYKEVEFLQNYLKRYNKILIHKISGNCLKHQHQLTKAIKRARYIGLLPFVAE
ncbi:30S ribosomal protein S18 [Mycoplasma wenyonii str. Massachusetts]|uniref:Small ribosomal subunit protein bS18 n=1 Tax=Mycoplasma wenyonii (strain Massachusetts) TaxID=1197325 RepID=I6YKU4_MYCWM|nr:30S ribosomal protein S18 [Mycoplasma wenyonii]AFN64829.1 30S ribosomal protein S18 [Mycoplasma wenyonii str. Massachusetts]